MGSIDTYSLNEQSDQVRESTSRQVNQEIDRQTEERLRQCASEGEEAINQRLRELGQEWDIERALMSNASTLSLIGISLAAAFSRKWLILPAVVSGFLLHHAVRGWCPPIPIFRRQGFRTRQEIEQERQALKALRGDYEDLPPLQGHPELVSDVISTVKKGAV